MTPGDVMVHTMTYAVEFITIKPLAATGSDARGSYVTNGVSLLHTR